MELVPLLQQFGLTEKQARIYLALLKLGTANVSVIATQAQIKRPTAYVLIDEMLSGGFVTESKTARDRLFSPIAPEVLKNRLRDQAQQFEQALPMLASMTQAQAGRPQVVVQEGKEAIIRAYYDALSSEQEICFMSDVDTLGEGFSDFIAQFNQRIVSEGRQVREVVSNTFAGRKYAREALADAPARQTRILDEIVANDTAIYGDTLLIVSFKENNYFLVKITNPQVAASFRTIFEQLWRSSKTVRPGKVVVELKGPPQD